MKTREEVLAHLLEEANRIFPTLVWKDGGPGDGKYVGITSEPLGADKYELIVWTSIAEESGSRAYAYMLSENHPTVSGGRTARSALVFIREDLKNIARVLGDTIHRIPLNGPREMTTEAMAEELVADQLDYLNCFIGEDRYTRLHEVLMDDLRQRVGVLSTELLPREPIRKMFENRFGCKVTGDPAAQRGPGTLDSIRDGSFNVNAYLLDVVIPAVLKQSFPTGSFTYACLELRPGDDEHIYNITWPEPHSWRAQLRVRQHVGKFALLQKDCVGEYGATRMLYLPGFKTTEGKTVGDYVTALKERIVSIAAVFGSDTSAPTVVLDTESVQ